MRALNFDVALEKRGKQHPKISSAALPRLRLTSALCIVISWAVFPTAPDCQCGLLNLRLKKSSSRNGPIIMEQAMRYELYNEIVVLASCCCVLYHSTLDGAAII